jgi:hypothetical protein
MDGRAVEHGAFPPCRACGRGALVPLSDFGPLGGEVRYKAWVCTNPACGFAVKIHGGEITRGALAVNGPARGAANGTIRPAPTPAAPPRSAPRRLGR